MKKIILLTLLFLLAPLFSKAATFSLDFNEENFKSTNRAEVSVWLLPSEEGINAVGSEIVINFGQAEFAKINDGNSIVSTWVESPRIENNKIIFSGIIPGGFTGLYSPFAKGPQPGLILAFSLISKDKNPISISLSKTEAFFGKGEASKISLEPLNLVIDSNKIITDLTPFNDSTAPAFVSAQIINLPDNKEKYLMFFAEDKESGIEYYEVQEGALTEPDEASWVKAESPYLLKDQSRKSRIFIKAINRNGQSSVTTIEPSPETGFSLRYLLTGVIIFIIVLSYAIYYRRKKL